MNIVLISAFLVLLSLQPAFAGYVLSMEEAEKLLTENSIELMAKKEELKKSEAEVTGARLLPNPEGKYSYVSVGSGQNDKEVTYSVVQPLDFAGKRGKRIETAENRRDAGKLMFDQEALVMRAQMKQLFYRILLLNENGKSIAEIAEMSREVESKTASRVESGDASEAELMKISAERKKIERLLDNLRIETGVERKRLALMLNLPDADFTLRSSFRYGPPARNVKDAAEGALDKRADVRAQAKVMDAAASALSLAKREAIPSVGVEAGYRRWAGGFDGIVFGLAIPFPLFDRGQGKIAAAYAEKEKQRLNYEFLKKYAANEVGVLLGRLTHYQARIAEMTGQVESAREMTKISRIAYEEGEANLIELLDAVRSERDLVMEYNGAVYEYWASAFELERATSSTLVTTGGNP